MGAQVGRACKIEYLGNSIVGMGTWTISGVDIDTLEDTEFADTYKTYLVGLRESGTIAFNGFYDPTDATGQTLLRTAWGVGTSITNIKLYVNALSYWIPATTAPTSSVYITSWDVSADKSGLVACSFTAKISGKMELL